jgi:hypothetical protein
MFTLQQSIGSQRLRLKRIFRFTAPRGCEPMTAAPRKLEDGAMTVPCEEGAEKGAGGASVTGVIFHRLATRTDLKQRDFTEIALFGFGGRFHP